MDKGIAFERAGHLGCIQLVRPEALNALTFPMVKAFYKQLTSWKNDKSILAVLIEAAPGRAFCAGGDVRALYEQGKRKDKAQLDFFWHEYRLNALIGYLDKPYISLMNGITMGGGVGVGLHGSHPIATEKFMLAMPETAIGLFPDIGASYLLSRLPGGMGMYLALTGKRLGPLDAKALGLVKYVIPEASLLDVVKNLKNISSVSEIDGVFKAVQLAPGSLPALSNEEVDKVERCFTQPSLEELLSAIREDKSDWGSATLALLDKLSPTSLKVTFEQMQRAKNLSLKQCLEMDEILVRHFMAGHDFYEGVRAMLIDKDKSPRWAPASLDAVGDVAAYFNP